MAKSPRQLGYKDRSVWELQQIVLARFDDFDDFTNRYTFPDLTTPVPLVLYLSQQEFTKLYTAVLTGADLSYPNQSHDIEYLYLQMVALPMAQLCAALADCIDNSSDVSTALNTWLQNNGYGTGDGNPPEPLPPAITGENLLPVGYVCTNDATFGMALAVVNSINEAVTEVLQAIEILTNPLELAAEMADNIPGASVLTAGADVAAWIQDTAQEGYDLAWSTVIRDELACLVWCAFKETCSLSFDTLWNVYLEESGIAPPTETDFTSWLEWLIGIAFGADRQTVATVSLLGLLAMRYGGKFGQFVLGIRTLDMIIKLAEDETSSDWDILCEGVCADWCSIEDFALSDGDWIPGPGGQAAGIWTDGVGWGYEDIIAPSSAGWRALNLDKVITSSSVSKISVNCDFIISLPDFFTNAACIILITKDGEARTDVLTILRDDAPSGTPITVEWEGTALTMDYIGLFFRTSVDNTVPITYGGTLAFHSIEICGEGTKPAELP